MKKRYILPVLWMAVIFMLSSIPGNEFPKQPFPYFTEVVHLIEYFILAVLLYYALGKRFLMIVVIGFLYAVSDEVHQLFVPFRECSILDIIVDFIGIILGIFIFNKLNLQFKIIRQKLEN